MSHRRIMVYNDEKFWTPYLIKYGLVCVYHLDSQQDHQIFDPWMNLCRQFLDFTEIIRQEANAELKISFSIKSHYYFPWLSPEIL